MRALRWLILVATAGCSDVALGCGGDTDPPAAADRAQERVPHGDHAPHHGGVVMMKGDLHYEVVLDPVGRYHVYFTDATRVDLPAATAAHASITILRPGAQQEGIELRIDDTGESWIGEGKPVSDPEKTRARIAYTIRGEEPYSIDLPFDAKPTRTEAHR